MDQVHNTPIRQVVEIFRAVQLAVKILATVLGPQIYLVLCLDRMALILIMQMRTDKSTNELNLK